MSTRKGRGGSRIPIRPRVKKQNVPPADDVGSPNLSSVDTFSFLEGIQGLNGNPPLHSTAIEEDLNVAEEEQANKGSAGEKAIPKKTTNKQRGAAAKRKETGGAKEPNTKRQKRTDGVETSPDMVTAGEKTPGEKSAVPKRSSQPAAAAEKRLVGKKPAKRKSAAQTSAARSVKSASKNSQNNPSQEVQKQRPTPDCDQRTLHYIHRSKEQIDLDKTSPRKRMVPTSDEEEKEDSSWKPSPKKTTLRLNRKSSTDRRSSKGRPADTPRRRKRPAARQQTEFDAVLDAFLEFCDKYRESAEPQQVQQSISTFSENVEAQLLEKISSLKEFKVLKRENTKMCSLIRTKTQRLLDRKQEMLGTEKEICQLETEKAQLQHRLTLLRRGQSFLHDIRELNRRYLDHRRRDPHQKETYGASSLPALLLETRHMKTALPQRKGDNTSAKKKTRTKK